MKDAAVLVTVMGALTDYIIPASYLVFTLLYFSLYFYFFQL